MIVGLSRGVLVPARPTAPTDEFEGPLTRPCSWAEDGGKPGKQMEGEDEPQDGPKDDGKAGWEG